MNKVMYDVSFTEPRSRATTFFRIILAIPHLIVLELWAIAAFVVVIIQWFVILFTGKRHEGMFRFVNSWLGYFARVLNYLGLMFDNYPKFGTNQSGVPMQFKLDYVQPARRLTNGLRFIWIIPAMIIWLPLSYAFYGLVIAQWFSVLFTGKANEPMWRASRYLQNYLLQLNAYALLLTDKYPKFDEPLEPQALPASPPPSAPGTPLPPPPGA